MAKSHKESKIMISSFYEILPFIIFVFLIQFKLSSHISYTYEHKQYFVFGV